jgi:aminopeptidase N
MTKLIVLTSISPHPIVNPLSNNQYIAVSNGLEQSQTINGTTKTTHFKHQYPIPAYLIAIAVTNYATYSHEVSNNGKPFNIVNYVYPETLESSKTATAITVDIMELFSTLFEEYPFASEKYGHAQFGWGGGMEHTTVSFMGSFSRRLIAHELAHQWFGNKVTCGSWKDIWLNEGFASYCEGLVIEHLDGNSSFTTWKQGRINYITSQTDGAVYLSDQDTTNVSRIFNGRLSYSKGAMVLHMLRKKMGDTQFYQGLQNYLQDPNHAYGYAKTEHLLSIMEAACGEDLAPFFNDWIYNEGYPSYSIVWNQPETTELSLQLSQTQSHPSVTFFEAPVPIRVHGTLGEVMDIVLEHSANNQVFSKTVNFTVASIEFDPENDLISKNNTVTLGLIEKNINHSITIYPNPTSNLICIDKPEHLSISSVKIYNALGQFINAYNHPECLDVSKLSSGLHFITIETNQGIFHKSLLKH